MTYRLLREDEWPRLREFMSLENVPNPALSRIVVAETETGELAAILGAQMTIHMEPLYIRKKFRHAVRFDKLAAKIEEVLGHKNYFCFSETPLIEKMLKFVGFVTLPYKIWKRQ